MSILEQALKLYAGSPPGEFTKDMIFHLRHGHVISSPSCMLMGRATRRDDVFALHDPAVCDTWLVWLAVGDMAAMIRAIPYPLPWVCWSRRGKALRFWRLESTLRHAQRLSRSLAAL